MCGNGPVCLRLPYCANMVQIQHLLNFAHICVKCKCALYSLFSNTAKLVMAAFDSICSFLQMWCKSSTFSRHCLGLLVKQMSRYHVLDVKFCLLILR